MEKLLLRLMSADNIGLSIKGKIKVCIERKLTVLRFFGKIERFFL
ncbi:hypothetical protein TREAZ_1664 [Leadbettera azotonutricia ZAS-9]|uniref:Uncharacterized protein n=1 Tax=Leadbettera azotonutricia (strain ATCC BAA-888 / DSM 13862 / ZAS-9) TaxID=545695 RepID=F5YD92_LEAAZ|nr:hypothetical protein TREAZ_1664 [Leadbettera azotonutricia ZAS-9]